MDEFFDIPTVIVIVIAIFVLVRLRSVLGTRTGNERPPVPRVQPTTQPKPANDERPATLRTAPTQPGDADRRALKLAAEIEQLSHGDAAVAKGRNDIAAADATFGPKSFI